ncbi:MAG: ABC transporter ATP-binding protein/permease [Alphaproteobacteria bacterium]|nr:ABC transporter ATP-binding protein/permease [Alphaproteobacteria bacterium]
MTQKTKSLGKTPAAPRAMDILGRLRRPFDRLNAWVRIDVDHVPDPGRYPLPADFPGFCWYFIRQIPGPIFAITSLDGIFAVMISLQFWYVGELVENTQYTLAMIWAGVAILTVRFFSGVVSEYVNFAVFSPYFKMMIRRQIYWHVSHQSLAYFQDDFAGRIANKLLQSAPRLKEAVGSVIAAIWFAAIFTLTNLWFLASAHWLLALPLFIWLVGYIAALWFFVPRIKARSTAAEEAISTLTGQVVDIFTNFLPIKYFARGKDEDDRVVGLLNEAGRRSEKTMMTVWRLSLVIDLFNMALLVGTAVVGFWLIDKEGNAGIAAFAMALPMVLQATFQSGWIMYEVASISENLGSVRESVEVLTAAKTVTDRPDAKPLIVTPETAEIRMEHVAFNYGQAERDRDKPVLKDFSLVIPAGQKVGLVGRSGAGKSTVTTLLVRGHDIRGGSIEIGGRNIADVTQDSLRRSITMITQETYLFHRSVADNIRYGRPDATLAQVEEAARRAHAHDFILDLRDNKGRAGYEAHVGERGVKLSGGQRQRISIARAILKDAPILILDEATSALDSESEQAIQESLHEMMSTKTVLAIAHRLSTLKSMDRIIVMDAGQIVEDGAHDDLIAKPDGHYAGLWRLQTGAFLEG